MAGYFDDLLESYRLEEPASLTEAPWSDPLLAPLEMEPPLPGSPAPESGEKTTRRTAHEDDFPSPMMPELAPIPLGGDGPDLPRSRPPESPSPEASILARETRVVERAPEPPDGPVRDARDNPPPLPPSPPVHVHEHVDRSVTHIHEAPSPDARPLPPEALSSGYSGDPTPTPAASEAPAAEPLALRPDPPGPSLTGLERELARALERLHGGEPSQLISAADFEPEALDPPHPPAEIETHREVTREVVREVHHHHHHDTETRIEQPTAPAPRTAGEASRIGPIRFASDSKAGL